MDIEELSDAVKRWNEWVEPPLVLEWMEPLVEAARLVANGTRALVVASLWIEGERQLVLVLEDDIDPAEGTPFYLVTPPGATCEHGKVNSHSLPASEAVGGVLNTCPGAAALTPGDTQ